MRNKKKPLIPVFAPDLKYTIIDAIAPVGEKRAKQKQQTRIGTESLNDAFNVVEAIRGRRKLTA